MTKTDLLAFVLCKIMEDVGISSDAYMIIASYCLKDMREVSDLDVIVLKDEYDKLKKNNIGDVSIAKISGDERIVLKFSNIDENAEIEFFPKDQNVGFPSNEFSIKKLQQNNDLEYDKYGNPYFNIRMCIEQYSVVEKRDGKYYMGNFEINEERIKKNINYLKNIKNFYKNNVEINGLVNNKIMILTKLLEK